MTTSNTLRLYPNDVRNRQHLERPIVYVLPWDGGRRIALAEYRHLRRRHGLRPLAARSAIYRLALAFGYLQKDLDNAFHRRTLETQP